MKRKGIIVAIFVAWGALAFAHGPGGTLTKEAGDYVIDIDYPASEVIEGEPLFFNARLLDRMTKNPIPLTNVEVIIVRDGQQIFSANIYKEPTKASGFTYTFPASGAYELHVVYIHNANELARGDFAIEAKAKARQGSTWDFYAKEVLVALAAGLAAGWFLANFFRFRGRLAQ
jgi:hypothetical protein